IRLFTSSTALSRVHFRNTADTANITSVTIASGQTSVSFKYNDTLAGSPLLTASDGALASPTVTQTETVNAAAAVKLAYSTSAQTLTAGVTSSTITVQLDDVYNNAA